MEISNTVLKHARVIHEHTCIYVNKNKVRYVCPSSERKAYENRGCYNTTVSQAGYTMHHFTCSSHATLPWGMTPHDACAQCNMCFMQRCFSLGSWILTVTSALVDNMLQL